MNARQKRQELSQVKSSSRGLEEGYQYGLAMIVLSTVLPILWFKRRGWL